MIVISDTTPIISLLKINHLELLNSLFGDVQIPDVVYEELLSVEEIEQCIDVLRSNGRHISEKLYEQLMEKIRK